MSGQVRRSVVHPTSLPFEAPVIARILLIILAELTLTVSARLRYLGNAGSLVFCIKRRFLVPHAALRSTGQTPLSDRRGTRRLHEPKFPIEALAEPVLPRAARGNGQGLCPQLGQPCSKSPGDHLRVVVAANMLRHALLKAHSAIRLSEPQH